MDDEVLKAIRGGDVAAYVAVIQSVTRTVVARLPNPERKVWTMDDIADLESSFYHSPAYVHAVLNAHDDESLRKLVYTGVANLVRAALRKTDRGRLHRRLKELLSKHGYVQEPRKFWRRAKDPPAASTAPTAQLMQAAWAVEVQVLRWRPDAKRNSPIAEGKSLLALLDALLDSANGAVHENVLVEVLGQRLGIGPLPAVEELDAAEERFTADPGPGPEDAVLSDEAELDAAVAALDLWGQLSPGECALVPHLASSAREAAAAVGGGKSAVNEAMSRLKEKFRLALTDGDDEFRRQVLGELLVLSGAGPDS